MMLSNFIPMRKTRLPGYKTYARQVAEARAQGLVPVTVVAPAVRPTKPPRTWHKTKAVIHTSILVSAVALVPGYFWAQSTVKRFDIQMRMANDPPPDTASTQRQTEAVLAATMFPQVPTAPTPLDVLRQADSTTRSPSAPLDRLRIAGVLHQAITNIRETRIRSIEELNKNLGEHLPGALGSNYQYWLPFFNAMDGIATQLNESGQFKDMNDVAKYLEGIEQLIRAGR